MPHLPISEEAVDGNMSVDNDKELTQTLMEYTYLLQGIIPNIYLNSIALSGGFWDNIISSRERQTIMELGVKFCFKSSWSSLAQKQPLCSTMSVPGIVSINTRTVCPH